MRHPRSAGAGAPAKDASAFSRSVPGAILCLLLLLPLSSFADSVAEMRSRLPVARGLERARLLAQLTDATRNEAPRAAIAYGREALTLLESTPDPEVEVMTCNELGWAHMMVSEYAKATELIERAWRLAEKTGNQKGLARAINNLGVVAQKQGDPVRAVELFTDSMKIQERLGNSADVANELNNLGFIYSTDLADYDRALAYHLEALKLREKLGDPEAIALSLNNIGVVYGRLQENVKAIEYFDQALEIRRSLGLQSRIAGTLFNIGDIRLQQGDKTKALTAHLEALQIRRTIGDPSAVAASLVNVGVIYTSLGKLSIAETYLNEALQSRLDDKGLLVRNHLALAELRRARGQYDEALQHAQLGLSVARQMSSTELIRRSLESVALIHEGAGRYREALAAYKTFKQTSDEIFTQERAKRLGQLESRYQTEKREREIERLKREEALRELAVSRQKLQRNTVAAGALLVLLIGAAAFRRHVEKSRLAEELSVTDSLTGLKNRRFLGQTIEADAAFCRRRHRVGPDGEGPNDGDMVILMLDIDHFKAVNDRYGHEAGDRVLQTVAQLLQRLGRDSDVKLRWGGEEFLIVSRFTHRSQGVVLAERVRIAFETTAFDAGNGTPIHLTCSIGVAAYPFAPREPEALTWQQLLNVADQALFLAKRSGRNAWFSISLAAESLPAGFEPGNCADEKWRGSLRIESSLGEPGWPQASSDGIQASDAVN